MIDLQDTYKCSEICRWPDGTVCWLDDLEEYLVFMDAEFEIIWVHQHELGSYGLT